MRLTDKIEETTFTMPAGYKFTTIEQGLRDAVNIEWSQKIELLKELQFREQRMRRMIQIGDKMAEMIGDHHWTMQWNAEKNL